MDIKAIVPQYEKAYFNLAIEKISESNYNEAIELLLKSKEWPENLGVGKPYNPDERVQNFLLFICYSNLNLSGANKFLEEVIDYSKENIGNISHNHILGYESIKRLEGNQSSNKFINKLTSAEINDISQIQ